MSRFHLFAAATLLIAASASAAPLSTDFDHLGAGPVEGEPRWPDWSLTPYAPEGTEVVVEDGRLVARDASDENAAVLTFSGEISADAEPVEVRFSLRVDPQPRSAGDDGQSRFAFVRFGPAFGEDLGFLRLILPGDAAEAGRVFFDLLSGEELVGPDGGGSRELPAGEPVEVVLRVDPEAASYALSIGGREVVADASLVAGVEPRLAVLSVHTPSAGRADLSLDDLSIVSLAEAADGTSAAAPAWPTREKPQPALLEWLENVDLRGGRLVDVPGFDLQDDEAEWQFQPHLYYWPVRDEAGITAWRSEVEKEWIGRHLYSLKTFPIESNRKYVVSALVKSRFDRANNEIDLGVEMLDLDHNRLPGMRAAGLPADTASDPDNVDGWVRWEWEFVTANYDEPVKGRFIFRHNIGYTDHEAIDLRFAQVKLIELPCGAARGRGRRHRPGDVPRRAGQPADGGGVGGRRRRRLHRPDHWRRSSRSTRRTTGSPPGSGSTSAATFSTPISRCRWRGWNSSGTTTPSPCFAMSTWRSACSATAWRRWSRCRRWR